MIISKQITKKECIFSVLNKIIFWSERLKAGAVRKSTQFQWYSGLQAPSREENI
jgi:hypothetical protein